MKGRARRRGRRRGPGLHAARTGGLPWSQDQRRSQQDASQDASPKSRRRETEFIRLNTKLCQACSACIEACPEGVIGLTPLPFHKHAVIVHPEKCQGCRKCERACLNGAITFLGRKNDGISVNA